jgi:hypothetical protein
MNPRLKEWFETKGRRLAELKVAGGQEYMILGYTKSLTEIELEEFRTLTIQMDAVIWALSPEGIDKQEKYIQEIKEFFSDIEEPYFKIRDITKGKKLPRGYA